MKLQEPSVVKPERITSANFEYTHSFSELHRYLACFMHECAGMDVWEKNNNGIVLKEPLKRFERAFEYGFRIVGIPREKWKNEPAFEKLEKIPVEGCFLTPALYPIEREKLPSRLKHTAKPVFNGRGFIKEYIDAVDNLSLFKNKGIWEAGIQNTLFFCRKNQAGFAVMLITKLQLI